LIAQNTFGGLVVFITGFMYQVPEPAIPSGAPNESFYISGSVHQPYSLGERVTVEEITELGQQIPQSVGKRIGRSAGPLTIAIDSSKNSGRASISLLQLIEKGILKPGPDQISCSYKGQTAVANLTEDGCIEYEGRQYQSATSFSITFKRTITPSKQGDDGWKSVMYGGKPLEYYRRSYRKRLMLDAPGEADEDETQDPSSMQNAETSSHLQSVEKG
jgi:hypothetical protein